MPDAYGRTREEGGFTNPFYALSGNSCVSGPYGSDDPTRALTNVLVGEHKKMTDVVIRDFHKRSAAGEVFMNPLSSTVETSQFAGQDFSVKKKSSSTCWSSHVVTDGAAMHLDETSQMAGFLPSYHMQVSLDEDSLRKFAGTEALGNVNAPVFESHVFFAELRETVSMIRAPFEGYYSWLKKMERLGRKHRKTGKLRGNPVTVYNFISNQWLQYRYGILPVCADAEAAMEALNTLETKPGVRKTARGYKSYRDSVSSTEYGDLWYGVLDATRVSKTTRELSVRAGILYELDTRNVWGRSWSDVPGAVWEAVPFSFVADWWTNVGDYLRAITPKVGVKELCSWTTITDQRETLTTCSSSDGTLGSWIVVSYPSSTNRLLTRQKNRIPGLTVGLAASPFTQAFRGDVGLDRCTDLVALTTQVLRRFV